MEEVSEGPESGVREDEGSEERGAGSFAFEVPWLSAAKGEG